MKGMPFILCKLYHKKGVLINRTLGECLNYMHQVTCRSGLKIQHTGLKKSAT